MSIEKITQKEGRIGNSFEERLRLAESIVLDYLYRFAYEEELVINLEEEVKSIVKSYESRCRPDRECLVEVVKNSEEFLNAIYATINEPVRLGAFRVLVNEVYRYVHGSPLKPYEDLAVHGLLREQQILPYSRRTYIGIDYIMLLEYPHPNRDLKVVVPLFIIAKSNVENAKNVKIKEAIDAVKNYIKKDDQIGRKLLLALDYLPRFSRVVIMRAKANDKLERCKLENGDLVIYPNIACGVLGIVLGDVWEVYNTVIMDEHLSKLTIGDWLYTLLIMVSPALLLTIEVGKSDDPPQSGGGRVLEDFPKKINDVLDRVRRSSENIKKLSKLLGRTLDSHLNDIIKRHSEKRRTVMGGRRTPLPA